MNNIKTKDRLFGNQKTELKIEAMAAWKSGVDIAEIARTLQKSRATIYKWLRHADQRLTKRSRKKNISFDSHSRSRILELWILLKRPSIRKLQFSLETHFAIRATAARLRYYLKTSGLWDYRPSSSFELILREESHRVDQHSKTRGGVKGP